MMRKRARKKLVKRTLKRCALTPGWYRLVGQTPVPCGSIEEASGVLGENRRVRLTAIGPFEVSTVFLGLDHSWFGRPPLLFETMTFLRGSITEGNKAGTFDDNDCDGRYSTWAEAEAGHQRAVDFLRTMYCHPGEEPEEIMGDAADASVKENNSA